MTVPKHAVTLGVVDEQISLSVPEWLELLILSQQSAHGFAVAMLTAPGAELGRVWHIPKAVIYRSIGRLLDVGLVEPEGTEHGRGPERTVYRGEACRSRRRAALAAHPGRARAGHPHAAAA